MAHPRGTLPEIADTGKALSVSSQVNATITAAKSDTNLCQMFFGWAPWE